MSHSHRTSFVQTFTFDEWRIIFKLSNMWSMQQILEGAKHAIMRMPDSRGQILGSQSTNTSSELSTAEQLGLARLHVQLFPGDHIKTLFCRLVSRKEPINPHEALALPVRTGDLFLPLPAFAHLYPPLSDFQYLLYAFKPFPDPFKYAKTFNLPFLYF